jgi:hypothetical protein
MSYLIPLNIGQVLVEFLISVYKAKFHKRLTKGLWTPDFDLKHRY